MQIFNYDKLDSSQEESKRLLAKNQNTPFLVLTKSQNSGKGTKNRSWFSPEGGLYMTLCIELDFNLIKDKKNIEVYSRDACLKTVEVLKESLEEYFQNPNLDSLKIKPINDLYFKKSKLAGILLETVNNSKNSFLLIGIGMNLKKIQAENLDRDVISLEEILAKEFQKNFNLDNYLELLCNKLISKIKAL